MGSAAASLGGGYSAYIGLSDTAIHRKIGGLDRLSCHVAVAVAALLLLAYPLYAIVGYIPTLVIASICVFLGADFLYSNLVDGWKENGAAAGLAGIGVLALCVYTDMLVGSIVGVAAFQLFGWWQRTQGKSKD